MINESIIERELEFYYLPKSIIKEFCLNILFGSPKAKSYTNDFTFNYRVQFIEDYERLTHHQIIFDYYYFLFMEDDRFRTIYSEKIYSKMFKCLKELILIRKFRLFNQGEREFARNAEIDKKIKFHVDNVQNSKTVEELFKMLILKEKREAIFFQF